MGKRMRIIDTLIICLTLGICSSESLTYAQAQKATRITEAYEYAVTPKDEAWKTLDSASQKREACYVAEEILEAMTTEALVETVIKYPLFCDVYAFDSVNQGIRWVSKYFKGIDILVQRSDAFECISRYRDTIVLGDEFDAFYKMNCDTLLRYLSEEAEDSDERLSTRMSVVNLFIEGSTYVTAYYGMSWADHGTIQTVVDSENEYLKTVYPNIVQLGTISPLYNCHSYAWYSSLQSNQYWVDDPTNIIMDLYNYKSNPASGRKVTYVDNNAVYYSQYWIHSGIVTSAGNTPSSTNVVSKWGCLGLFSHKIDDCPYYISETDIMYWEHD